MGTINTINCNCGLVNGGEVQLHSKQVLDSGRRLILVLSPSQLLEHPEPKDLIMTGQPVHSGIEILSISLQ